MSGFKVNFSVNNQLATPSIHAAALANRPAFGQPGRVFIDTDNPSTGIYRDTGTAWIQIAATSSPEADTLQTVTNRGNVTTQSITVGAATAPVGTIDVRKATAGLNGANDWAIVSNNNPVIASGASFGVNYVNAVYGAQSLTFSGNATIGNTGINSAGNFINTLSNNASGTITVAQGSGTNRAIAGVQAGIYYNTPNAMTFTHVAGIKTLQPINSGAVGASVTNYYGVHVGDSTPSSGTISYTNRWGIYQEGASDVNYFAGNFGIGTTTPSGTYKLHIVQSANQALFEGATQGQIEVRRTGTNGIQIVSPANNELGFYSGGAGAYRMYLFGNGNLAIGTTTDAGQRLQVSGNIRQTYTATRYIDIGQSGTYGQVISVNALAASEFAQLNLSQSGSVGFQVDSGGQIRTFNTDLYYTGYAGLENFRSNFYAGFVINEQGRNDVYFRVEGDTDTNLLYTAPATDRVGIGTGSPAAKLHLNGTLRIDGQTAATAGGSAGLHLIVNLDGTNYKIALLNV